MHRHIPTPSARSVKDPSTGLRRSRTALASLGLGAALLGLSGMARAQTVLTFDDLGPAPAGQPMPATYATLGFTNTQWFWMTNANAPKQVFLALGGGASFLRKADGSGFYFDGADFWSRRSLDANGNFYFVLSYKGKVVYDGRSDKLGKMRFTGTSTLLRPNYTGPVDYVAIAFDKQGRGGDWDQLAMDNVRLRPL